MLSSIGGTRWTKEDRRCDATTEVAFASKRTGDQTIDHQAICDQTICDHVLGDRHLSHHAHMAARLLEAQG